MREGGELLAHADAASGAKMIACGYLTLVPHLDPPSIALTHPEVVEALGHAEVLGRDVCLKVLVETWLQWDEFGQWWEVVHSFCR